LLLVLGQNFVYFRQDNLVGDCVATEKSEDVGVVLFYAVFAVDKDEGSTESGGATLNQNTDLRRESSQGVGID
jgi:hypothetical protein